MSTLITILQSPLKVLGFTLIAFALLILSIWWICTSIYRQKIENGWQALLCSLIVFGTLNCKFFLVPVFDAFEITARAMKIFLSYLPYMVLVLIPTCYRFQQKRKPAEVE